MGKGKEMVLSRKKELQVQKPRGKRKHNILENFNWFNMEWLGVQTGTEEGRKARNHRQKWGRGGQLARWLTDFEDNRLSMLIAKSGEQLKCLLTDEWLKKMWYKYNGILFNYKEKEIWSCATTCKKLEYTVLSEVNHRSLNTTWFLLCHLK